MLLLAADTSGKHGTVALARCGPDDACNLLEMVPLEGGAFSAQLVPQIAALLSKNGFTKNDIGGFAVVSGPGSFTGVRVGLAAIKALAEVLQKPIAAISLLEAIVVASRSRGRVTAVLDAGRSEFYVGQYEVRAAEAHLLGERLLTRAELLELAPESTLVTTDSSLSDALRQAGTQSQQIALPRSDMIAQLGWRKIRAGKIISAEGLDANYIRRPVPEVVAKSGS